MARNAYPKQAGKRVPKGSMVDMRAPVVRSRVGGISGTGAGYGFGSGHEGKLRRGPHPNAPKNG